MKKVAQGWSGTPHGTLLGTLLAAVFIAAGGTLATPNPDCDELHTQAFFASART